MTQVPYPKTNDLTREEVDRLFEYRDGQLFWKERGIGRRFEKPVGTKNSKGYFQVEIKGVTYKIHRLIWVMHGNDPVPILDHVDGNRGNNKIQNLRPATSSQNCMNRKHDNKNAAGATGVFWYKALQKWQVRIWANNKSYHGGYFDCPKEAAKVAASMRKELHGSFAKS